MNAALSDHAAILRWVVKMERRRRVLRLIAALACTACICAALVIVLVSLDRALALPRTLRLAASGMIAAGALTAIAAISATTVGKVDYVASARSIERVRPNLDERLLTLVSRSIEPGSQIGRRLVEQVQVDLQTSPPLWKAQARRAVLLAAVAAALVMVLLVGSRRPAWAVSEKRVLQPWTTTPAASSPTLVLTASTTAVKRRDATIALEARVRGSNADETVVLHVRDRSGETSIVMTPQGQNRFARTLNRLLQSVDVYATTPELRSRTLHIAVSSSPATHLAG